MGMKLTKTNMIGVDREISKTTVLYEEMGREGVQDAYGRYETARIIQGLRVPVCLACSYAKPTTKIGGYPVNAPLPRLPRRPLQHNMTYAA